MKQILYVLLFTTVGILALIEQSKPAPNRLIMIGAMAVFMYGLFQLMKKIPSKKEEDNDTEI
jgi:arginine exporter protein ArgO